jgi:hypothetical protein
VCEKLHVSENNIINVEAAKGEMFKNKNKNKLGKKKKNIFFSLTFIHKNIQPNLAIGQI